MRVLYIDHPEADFMSAILYMGLCQEIGSGHVLDFPRKGSFHGEVDAYPSFYTPGEMGSTAPFEWFDAPESTMWDTDTTMPSIKEFDLIILAAPRKNAIETLRAINPKGARIVIVDGEDYSEIRLDLIDEFKPRVYFKREAIAQDIDRFGDTRIVPFPFASPIWPRARQKDIDVLFVGGRTWAGRDEACAALKNAFGPRFVGGADIRYGYPEYIDAMARAKIAVSVRGHGYDTLRFWEIPSCPGTLLAADRLPLIRPFPFQDGEHAIYFSTPDELVRRVEEMLSNDAERARIAQNGNSLLRTHHTARARAKQLLLESFK